MLSRSTKTTQVLRLNSFHVCNTILSEKVASRHPFSFKKLFSVERAHRFNDSIPARCRCCDVGDDEAILHILRCPSRKEVHLEHNETFVEIMRYIKAPNHLLSLFEAGIEVTLLDVDTYSGEDWNGNRNGSTIDRTISEKLFDKTIPHQYKTVFQQQAKLGWEHLFMGKMVLRH